MTTYTGSNGNDQVQGILTEANVFNFYGQGRDVVLGGNLDDVFTLTVDRQKDYIEGNDGTDTLNYHVADRGLTIDLAHNKTSSYFFEFGSGLRYAEVTEFYGIENVIGSKFNDTIIGNDQNNVIDGGAGADHIDGGIGQDTVTYANSKAAVTVDLSMADRGFAGQVLGVRGSGGYAEGDTLVSIENVIGSNWDDVLISGKANEKFTGGIGNDQFVFTKGIGHDIVTDFDVRGDVIVLRADQVLAESDDFRNVMEQDGLDVVIEIGDDTITLKNVYLDDLAASNVWLV